jgi:hypothetical protein
LFDFLAFANSAKYQEVRMRNLKHWSAVVVVLAISITGSGSDKKKKEPSQPTVVKLTVAVPSLAALAETDQSQTKGGLRITIKPESYLAKESMKQARRQVPPPTFLGLVAVPDPRAVYVETTYMPDLIVSPDRLVFHVNISNQMPRVFRGSGIAVQFNVAGKIAAVDSSGYGDLTNIIVPPRGEQEITVLGPPIEGIPAPSTIGLFFYDVVTNTDQAGNVTEKQNFEWYFSYQTQTTDKEFSIPPPTKGWVIPR